MDGVGRGTTDVTHALTGGATDVTFGVLQPVSGRFLCCLLSARARHRDTETQRGRDWEGTGKEET